MLCSWHLKRRGARNERGTADRAAAGGWGHFQIKEGSEDGKKRDSAGWRDGSRAGDARDGGDFHQDRFVLTFSGPTAVIG